MIAEEKKRYVEVERPALKEIILHRLEDWRNSLERRLHYFMQLPHHVKGVQDLPDLGLYDYKPLPERLGVAELRTVLGTGLQSYVGKTRRRDPQAYVILKIRVPKERVLTREETYTLHSGKEIKVKKYAIAGGLSLADFCKNQKPTGARYIYGLLPEHAKSYQEYWKAPKSEK